MNKFAVNLTLYSASLIVLVSLLYSAQRLNSRTEELRKFTSLLYIFTAGNLCCLVFTLFYGIGGRIVHFIQILSSTSAYILAAYGIPLFASYLYRARKIDYTRRGFKTSVLKAVFIFSAMQMIHAGLNLFTHTIFIITPDNRMHGGNLFWANDILIIAQMLMMMVLIGIHPNLRLKKLPLRLICFLPLAAAAAMIFDRRSGYIYPSLALSLLLVYVNVHLQDEHALRQNEIELRENRLSLLMGQIQPHFLFNVLNTIYYLCDTDPEKALEATRDFRMFLENATVNQEYGGTVPFEQELEYVRHYLDLEKLRFDQISIIYDIQTADFSIPPLTVQPLAENAIRHGLREMAGGEVIISSRKTDMGYTVEVRDNGIGYNPKPADDGRAHVGIENVRNRLSIVYGASLSIEPLSPHGTSAKITIPFN